MSTTPTPTQDPSKPIEIELGNGMVIKGANLEEAIQNAKKIVTDNVTYARSEREKREAAEAEAQALRTQLNTKTEPAQTNGFNNQRYYQLLNEDPIAAQNYMDQFRFGVPDPVASFNQMRQRIDYFEQANVVASFNASHPEFSGSKDDARALTQRYHDLIANGFPVNVDTLNYAYQQAIADGSVKPLDTRQEEPQPAPNPSLSGGGSQVSNSELSNAENLSDEDLRKLLRSKGMIV